MNAESAQVNVQFREILIAHECMAPDQLPYFEYKQKGL